MSGVFEHRQIKLTSPLLRGFDDRFWAPHSRYTYVNAEDIERHPHLELVAVSDEAGVYIAKSTNSRHFFVFGHPEYDRATLNSEYERDVARGLDIAVPAHYYPEDDPSQPPSSNWRAHAQLLYTNWLNYYVYQTTPYDIEQAGEEETNRIDEEEAHKAQLRKRSTPVPVPKPAAQSSEFLRAENEDDDGYDPYSDRREESPLFEPDPWK